MPRCLKIPGLILALAALGLPSRGQDYQHVGPKAMPPLVAPAVPANAPAEKPLSDTQVLVKNLQGVVFVASPKQVVASGVDAHGVLVRDAIVPDPSEFDACVQPY